MAEIALCEQRFSDSKLVSPQGPPSGPGPQAFACLACWQVTPLRTRYGPWSMDLCLCMRECASPSWGAAIYALFTFVFFINIMSWFFTIFFPMARKPISCITGNLLIYVFTHHLQVRSREAEPMKKAGLSLARAYNEWEDGEAEMDLARDALPVNLTRMTKRIQWKWIQLWWHAYLHIDGKA